MRGGKREEKEEKRGGKTEERISCQYSMIILILFDHFNSLRYNTMSFFLHIFPI